MEMDKQKILDKHISLKYDKKKWPAGYPYITEAMEEYAKAYTKDFIERISRNPISCYSVKTSFQEKRFFLGQDYINKLLESLK